LRIPEPNPNKWHTRTAPFFDAAYERRAEHSPRLCDLLFLMLDQLEFDPRQAGVPHPSLGIWIYESVPIRGLPRIFVLYEISDDGRLVTIWSLALRDAAT
jgi:hypothetical protein